MKHTVLWYQFYFGKHLPSVGCFLCSNSEVMLIKVNKVGKELFSMPVFTSSFAEKFLAEVQHFKLSKLSHEQSNSMNRHGVLLDEIGFQDFISRVREEYIQPQVKFSSGQRNLIHFFLK